MGHLAASLLHNFRFDGIEYDRCIDTSSGAFPIRYRNIENSAYYGVNYKPECSKLMKYDLISFDYQT